ncbi:hypothetical protein GCM10022222_37130 [Amycolatopsis ultiminotia]|uniref:DinB-like domain-containing protein n=1 Tax=Amycolatopsis ultiminotia TaxID=543629 RepID=A0ABP6WGN7_9PSEU
MTRSSSNAAALSTDRPTEHPPLDFLRVGADTERVDRQAVHDEMERARIEFHRLLDQASDADLRRASNGTRWTNRELLFHMLLGYLIGWALRNLVALFNRLPASVGKRYAQALNAVTVPFDAVNYVGSRLGGNLLKRRGMAAVADRAIARLHQRLDRETEAGLARTMHFPTRWDPYFRDRMSLADVYRFPTQHFDHHARQLTLHSGSE